MPRPKFDRNVYYHQARMTALMCEAIEGEIRAFCDEDWRIEFTTDFTFRIVDRHTPGVSRDFGWYYSLDKVGEKLGALFPNLVIKALTA